MLKNLKKLAVKFNYGLTSSSELIRLQSVDQVTARSGLQLIAYLPSEIRTTAFNLLDMSKSQVYQDLFVLANFNFKRNGYFVEFVATNGENLSNTYLLETQFNWNGILAEPAKTWHLDLESNRPNAIIEKLCVWRESKKLLIFSECKDAELSTLKSFSDFDGHKMSRIDSTEYEVETISLRDLLVKHRAPKYIDYLSIDTEGSEFEILNSFNFNEYQFGVITCEHNFSSQKEKIYELLLRNGYKRVHEDISRWDGWYIGPTSN
jgi:FkbM family methyltransferase